MTEPHPLDHPIWSALTTRQASIAEGGPLAWRYPAEIAPFAAIADNSKASFAALAVLIPPSGRAVLCTVDPVTPPESLSALLTKPVEQMVMASVCSDTPPSALVTLGAADVPEMLELVALTNPGPFGVRTHELGRFQGLREGGRLVAMAGERMKLDGFTEITAICTHPDHRGRGHARILLEAVAHGIAARGETPFLHVFADNHAAIALYLRCGLTIRKRLHIMALGRHP